MISEIVTAVALASSALGGSVSVFAGVHDEATSFCHPATKHPFVIEAMGISKNVFVGARAVDVDRVVPIENRLQKQIHIWRQQAVCAVGHFTGIEGKAVTGLSFGGGTATFETDFFGVDFAHQTKVMRRCLTRILDFYLQNKSRAVLKNRNGASGDTNVSAQLPVSSLPSNSISLVSEANSDQHQQSTNAAYPSRSACPPGRVSGCIRRFPLSAQIGVSLILSGLAWFCLLIGAFRPFGLLVIGRRDVLKALSYGLLGIGLLCGSFGVWMMGG